MKSPRGLDRLYRERCKDERVTALLERFLGVTLPSPELSAYLKAQRTMRVAAGRATKMDRRWMKAERRIARRRAKQGNRERGGQ